jgi:hypothetical protein
MLEKCYEYTANIHLLFVDYKEAYDSVDRSKLSQVLEEMQIPRKTNNLVCMILRRRGSRSRDS